MKKTTQKRLRSFRTHTLPRAHSARVTPSAYAPEGVQPLEGRTLFAVSIDSAGWTVVTPAADPAHTRIVYVSSSTGSESNSGLAPDKAVATIAKGRSLIRSGYADWLLLKRGDVFNESILQWDKTGRSAQEPVLISAYGTGARPRLLTGTSNGFTTGAASVSNVYVIGLHFESNLRNPDRPGFNADLSGGSYGIQMLSRSDNVLFEDIVVDAYKTNISVGRYVTPSGVDRYASNVTIRRSQVLDAYNKNGSSQGLYAEHVRGLRLEENLFDHNGWDTRASAWQSQLNHNVYLHSSTSGVVFAGNVTANASSHGLQARGGGTVRDNVFIANPIGMSFGLVNGSTVRAGGVEGEVSGNVFLHSASIGTQGRGWGIEIGNTKPGGSTAVRDNIFAHDTVQLYPAIMLSYGFSGDNSTNSVGLNDLTVEGNIVYKWYQALSTNKDFISGGTGQTALNDLLIRNNDFQTLADSRIILHNHVRNAAEETWQNNRYWDDSPASTWFSRRSVLTSFDQWKADVEPTAQQIKQDYADPDRTAGSYNATLGGAATSAAYIAELRRQAKGNWRGQYTAGALIDYVRGGFRIDSGIPTATLFAADVTAAGGKTHTFSLVYRDDTAINAASISSSNLRVTGPDGYGQAATLVSVAVGAESGSQVATYRINAPGGSWNLPDDGVYTVSVQTGQVADESGKFVAAGAVGSFRVRTDRTPPRASATAANVSAAGGTTHAITVLYTDNGRLDTTTFDSDDIRVRGPGGYDAPATIRQVSDAADGSPRSVTYNITPRGGSWDAADAGTYTIYVNANEIRDTSGLALPADNIGSFNVSFTSSARPTTTSPPTPARTAPPYVTHARLESTRSGDRLIFRFSQDVSASLRTSDFVVGRTKAGVAPLSRSTIRLAWNRSRNEAIITFPGLKNGRLQTANWRATLLAQGIRNAAGLPLDANRDGRGGDDHFFSFKKS